MAKRDQVFRRTFKRLAEENGYKVPAVFMICVADSSEAEINEFLAEINEGHQISNIVRDDH